MTTTQKTLSCVTCHQPLPEGQEPEYFARTGRDLPEDDMSRWGDDLHLLLIFSSALSNALYQLAGSDDSLGPEPQEAAQGLSRLGWELTREIDRRIRGLSRAGKVWEERAKAMNTATGKER